MRKRCLTVTLLATLLLTALTGCDPLTRNRFDIITIDVADKFDVEQTLGKPTHRLGDQWNYDRPGRHLNVLIDFNKDGVATRKQWIDTAANEWTDTAEPGDTSTRERTRIRTIK